MTGKLYNEKDLNKLAAILRGKVIRASKLGGIPHLGSCLSCCDLLTSIYFKHLRHDPGQPNMTNRDRFILSKGHGAPALFQVLSMAGYIKEEALEEIGKNGSIFAEHPPAPHMQPGIEAATGSLGHGLPISLGHAISSKINSEPYNVFTLLSDGECNEGSVWESALMASAQKMENLCAIIDYNKWQATGRSDEVLGLAPLANKWKSFGWHTIEINGHSFSEIEKAIYLFKEQKSQPTAIIAHTVKGKGVSFMEDDNNWHYRTPDENEVEAAFKELGLTS